MIIDFYPFIIFLIEHLAQILIRSLKMINSQEFKIYFSPAKKPLLKSIWL